MRDPKPNENNIFLPMIFDKIEDQPQRTATSLRLPAVQYLRPTNADTLLARDVDTLDAVAHQAFEGSGL